MRPLPPTLALFTCLALALPSTALAQVPDEFTNLKVLPRDIAKGELIEVMKSFALGLDVRCEHCHVGEPGQPLSTFDFASDDKEPKRVARVMLQMTHDVNARLAAELGRDPGRLVEVRCVTCHRGLARPRLIGDVLAEETADDGVEAALATYRRLRDELYGSGAYDFGLTPLMDWASQLAYSGHTADALIVIATAEELFPDSIGLQSLAGDVYRLAGDRELAVARFRRVLELDPGNHYATRRLEELQGADQ